MPDKSSREHICNDKCGTLPNQPHWYPDWEAADAAWRNSHYGGGDQQERMAWKDGYVQAYNDLLDGTLKIKTGDPST